MSHPANISGFIEIDSEPIPADNIEPLDNLCGSTCLCFLVHYQGKRLLMKRLRPEFVANPRYVEIFHKEFETGSRLHNPYLVNYVSMGEDANGPYLVMDYVDGVTLAQKMQMDPEYFADSSHVSRLFSQLLSVLDLLHNNQVLHLDLKPENIMLTRISNNVKLIDLGFCYTDSYYNTMGCNMLYAAPEQLYNEKDKINVGSDLYAVGRLLLVVSVLNPKLTRNDALQSVISKAIDQNPARRYSSAHEMSQAITAALRPRRLSKLAIIVVIDILFIAIVISILLWGRNFN